MNRLPEILCQENHELMSIIVNIRATEGPCLRVFMGAVWKFIVLLNILTKKNPCAFIFTGAILAGAQILFDLQLVMAWDSLSRFGEA